MVLRIISLIFVCVCVELNAQQFISNNGIVSFYSETPLENISAVNKNVSAAYDLASSDLVFQLDIKKFIFLFNIDYCSFIFIQFSCI